MLQLPEHTGVTRLDPRCVSCTSPEDDVSTIAVSDFWKIVLHPDQTVPGSLLIVSLRHVPKLGLLKPDESADFFDIYRQVEAALESAMGATMVNLSCLRNWAFRENDPIPPLLDGRPNPHVHWHVAPRYREPVVVAGRVFRDEDFGDELRWRGVVASSDEQRQIIATVLAALGITPAPGPVDDRSSQPVVEPHR